MICANLGKQLESRETRLAALDASIMRGIADAEAGRTAPAGKVFDRLEARLLCGGGCESGRV